jgi:uncharacterized protein
MEVENPFVFDRPLEDRKALVGREDELTELSAGLRAGNEVLLEGPSRHGKTSLINAALSAVAVADGGLGVRIDCSGVLTTNDFVRRLEKAYGQAWGEGAVEEALVERLEALPFRLPGVDASRLDGRLQGLLEVNAEVAEQTGCRVVVGFDEVQDVLALPDLVEAIQHSRARAGDRVGHLLAGPDLSSQQRVAWSDRAATVKVSTIEPVVFAGEIMRRFANTGRDAGEAAKIIATVGAGHPQRTNLLASQLWELTSDGERATVATARTAIEQALVRCGPEFDLRWNGLHSNERRVAVAIANEIAPQGTRAQRATGLAGAGAAQRALQGIKASGVAQVREERLTLTDPLFAEWLRRRYSQIPAEPDWQALRRRTELQRGSITRGM